jgi:hypothetical protein
LSERSGARRRDLDALIAERTAAWSDVARETLVAAVASLNPSVRHLTDVLDWLDDIAARDGGPVGAPLGSPPLVAIVRGSGAASERLKRWKDALRRMRYPRLVERETALADAIAALRLGPDVTVMPPRDLEGGVITLTVRARTPAEVSTAVERLRAALEAGGLDRVFAVLTDS